jgi:hypothetical protein
MLSVMMITPLLARDSERCFRHTHAAATAAAAAAAAAAAVFLDEPAVPC